MVEILVSEETVEVIEDVIVDHVATITTDLEIEAMTTGIVAAQKEIRQYTSPLTLMGLMVNLSDALAVILFNIW